MTRDVDARGPVSWTRPAEAVVLCLRGVTVRTAAPVALVVGTVLSVANQGHLLFAGTADAATWARVAVNFLIPFLVASIGFLSARLVRAPDPPAAGASRPGRGRR